MSPLLAEDAEFSHSIMRVVRLIPSRTAAPCGPPTIQLVCRNVSKIYSRSTSWSVAVRAKAAPPLAPELIEPELKVADSNSASGGQRVLPGERMTARSIKFCNSRTLPG